MVYQIAGPRAAKVEDKSWAQRLLAFKGPQVQS